jgi:hypothetical protein
MQLMLTILSSSVERGLGNMRVIECLNFIHGTSNLAYEEDADQAIKEL